MNLKNELIKTLSQKISITEILHFEEKEAVKTMSKGAMYKYILAFAGWQSIFWWWWMHFGWWWVVVDIFWLVVGGGGWWWMVVNIIWLVVGGGNVQPNPIINKGNVTWWSFRNFASVINYFQTKLFARKGDFQNYKYKDVNNGNFKKPLHASANSMKNDYLKIAHKLFTGRSIFSYLLRLTCHIFRTALTKSITINFQKLHSGLSKPYSLTVINSSYNA